MTKATIIVPTHNHGILLNYSIHSILTQTIQDFEVFIIGDGVDENTRHVATSLANCDKRIQFVEFPKSARTGEPHRHTILQKAKGQIVCYLSDDDLWLPTHLEIMEKMLKTADFAHTFPVGVNTNGNLSGAIIDLSIPFYRNLFLSKYGGEFRIPLRCGGHTLSFYHTLPYGWRTTPIGISTDVYMWQQILSQSTCKAISSMIPTTIAFPSPIRKSWTIERRREEIAFWTEKISTIQGREEYMRQIIEWQAKTCAQLESCFSIRLANLIKTLPIIGPTLQRMIKSCQNVLSF